VVFAQDALHAVTADTLSLTEIIEIGFVRGNARTFRINARTRRFGDTPRSRTFDRNRLN
jgi:hypothetical protein